MAKRKKRTPAQKKAAREKAFTFFTHLVRGAVKIWMDGKPWILPAEQIKDFMDAKVREIAGRK
jgi:hypothetical protein